jgi:hypothetical protein
MEVMMRKSSSLTRHKEQLREGRIYRFMYRENQERSIMVKNRRVETSGD